MVTVAICDSEILFRKNMIACCKQYLQEKKEDYEILEYESGEDVLMASFPDILLIDVKLKGINGLLVKEILWKKAANTRIIFVSETKRWMPDAFGKNVFGYLIKPIKYTCFCEKMDVVLDDFRAKQRGIYCKTGNMIKYILFKDIVYIKAKGRYTEIHLQDQEEPVICCMGISFWEKLEGAEGFVRVNRWNMVNPAYVISIQQGELAENQVLQMMDGVEIPISKNYYTSIQKKYREWKDKYR